jgi:anti-anti-sigma factor
VTDDGWVEVRLVGLPAQVHGRVSRHVEALNREFELIRRAEDGSGSVPDRLITLIEELRARFAGLTADTNDTLGAAIDQGDAAVDLLYRVPPAVADAARQLGALLDEADEYCARGEHLLTLKTPDEGVVYRRWFLGEFMRQVGGAAPIPWDEYVDPGEPPWTSSSQAVPAATGGQPVPEGWQVTPQADHTMIAVHDDLDLQSAPTLRGILQDVRSQGAVAVRIDLRDCRFVDSVGISVLVSAHHRFTAEGDRLELVVSEQVRQLLRLSGLEDVLSLADA